MKNASAKEEKKVTIKQAGMLLSDDELDQVAGGTPIGSRFCSYDPCCPFYGSQICVGCSGAFRNA